MALSKVGAFVAEDGAELSGVEPVVVWVPNIVSPHATWAYLCKAAESISSGDLDLSIDGIG